MSKTVLWIFGVLPATVMLGYSLFMAVLIVMALVGSPLLGLAAGVLYVASAVGAAAVILVILEKPLKNARYGLYAALPLPALTVVNGLAGIKNLYELPQLLAAVSILVVVTYLLRTGQYWRINDQAAG